MVLTAEKKKEIVKQFQKNKNDSGSSEVQVAILTNKISELTNHLSKNPKDYAGQKGLLILVGKRKRLLRYLQGNDPGSYRRTVDQLSLRG